MKEESQSYIGPNRKPGSTASFTWRSKICSLPSEKLRNDSKKNGLNEIKSALIRGLYCCLPRLPQFRPGAPLTCHRP
eukprot:12925875-Prorocentrum_lima.AAC.1